MQTDPTPKILRATGAALLLLSACGGRSNMSDQTSCREPALAAAPAPQPEIIAPPAPPAPIAPLGEHPFSARDLLAFARVSDPQVSPDGRRVAYVVRETDLEANRGRTEIWLGSADGSGAPVVLAAGAVGDHSPRWSPDGRTIYFLSRRSGSAQIWATSPEGGEPRQITDLPLPLSALVVAPDGQHLAFSAEVYLDCDTLACTAERLAAEAADPASGRRYDRLFARHWDTWKDGRRAHLFVIDQGGGAPIDVTAGLDADVPSKPFGGDEEITFTPDSQGLVFAARDVGAEEPWSTNFDLFYAPIRGRAAPRRLTDNPAWDTRPRFSPDGATLYYLAMRRPGFEADRFAILARPWPEGQPTEIAPSWDRSPHDLEVSADGRTLYVTADHLGRAPLFAIDAASGQARELVSDGYQSAPKRAGDHLLFLRDHLRSPAELHRVPLAGGALEPITQINRQRLANARMGEPEQFTFPGWKGEPVHAWLVKPVDYRPDQKYPLVLLIHGGPQGSFGDHFHYRWNPQFYAGRGYAALMIDFHGSTGYGQAFTDSISDDWGGKPLVDLQAGLAAALARYPILDGDRVCALGASYGGFMINWIAGNWPDRFRCLVNHDGVFDNRMMYYATEELWFPEWEHRGPYYQNVAAHERHNPVHYVERWKTPMLVIHGSLDYRIPETQGLAAFTALQRRGVPSRLVVFPDENHWVLKPANSLQWHDEVGTWLDTWLRGS
jgi:dipeptidyl aminopeptidase/acylaminoacyl peptidase